MTTTEAAGVIARRIASGCYDELKVGDCFTTRARTVTEADLVMFSSWSGDWSALHTDEEWVQTKGPFDGRIAHGCLTLSLATGLEFTLQDPTVESGVVAFYGMDRVRFTKPVFIGDTLHLEGEITNLEDKNENQGVVTIHQEIKNQRDETVAVLDKRTLRRRRNAV